MLADPDHWGRLRPRRPQRVNVEFVSANPTGPLHIGNARGAFVGDLLSRVLEAGGHQATREYYFNDFGRAGPQPRRIDRGDPRRRRRSRRTATARRTSTTSSPTSSASELAADGRRDADAAAWTIGRWASEQVRRGIEASLARLGVRFDVWKTESSLHDEGWVERAVERLRERGHVYEDGGATWFRSTAFGDDKDRVIRKSNGEPTYFAADIGYVTEKFSRGFDHLIYIWGADHHGTVARLRNAAEAMGFDKEAVEILLTAWVRFVRDGVEISMSKRAGDFITLDELLERDRGRRRPLVLRLARAHDRHRLRHRARQAPAQREPRLLRAVRARADRLDPAQGGRRRPRRGSGMSSAPCRGGESARPEALLARALARYPGGRRGRRWRPRRPRA